MVASELIRGGDVSVVAKIIEFMEHLAEISEERDVANSKLLELVEQFNKINSDYDKHLNLVNELNNIDSILLKNKDEIKSLLNDVEKLLNEKVNALSQIENNNKQKIDNTENKLSKLISEFSQMKESMPKHHEGMSKHESDIEKLKQDVSILLAKENEPEDKDEELKGEEIVEMINSLPLEDEYKIDKSHIKGLEDLEKQISTLKKGSTTSGFGVVGRDLFKDIDLSSQLDGVTTTFQLPAVWNIITVNLSSFPFGSLRKGIDFTYTSTAITFTSQIDPATQLASGQSCILTVVTA